MLNTLFVCPKNVVAAAVIRPRNVIDGFDLTTGNSELDFVLQAANGVYPLEVKSATNTKAKSLGVYMRGYTPALAFKSSLKNYSESRDVKSIPLYALGIALPPMLA